ncbi:hypothetical protein [Streptomyces sp. NPDC023588]
MTLHELAQNGDERRMAGTGRVSPTARPFKWRLSWTWPSSVH